MTEPITPATSASATPPVAEALPGTPDAEGWRRLHPLSPLMRGGIALIVIASILIANMRDHLLNLLFGGREDDSWSEYSNQGDIIGGLEYLAAEGLLFFVFGGILLVIALIVLFSWIAWKFSTYRVTADAVEARRGVLFRTHRRAPLERIQSVNLQRSLVARIIGLTKIDITTAGNDGKVELAYLGYRDAKTVREQILRSAAAKRRGNAAPAQVAVQAPTEPHAQPELQGQPEPHGQVGPLPQMATDPQALNISQPVSPALATTGDLISQRADDFIDADVDPAAVAAQSIVRVPFGRLLGSIMLGWEACTFVVLLAVIIVSSITVDVGIIFALLPLLIVMGSVMFGQLNKGFTFTLSRAEDAVRIGAGLTATSTETIPFGRIHAVEARQPLGWRPFGWWKVRVTIAGHSVAQAGQNQMQNVVLPVGREDDVLRVLETLFPGIGDEDAEIAELRNGLTGPGDGYLKAGPRAGWVLWWGRKRAGITIDVRHDTLRTRRGIMTRSLAIMPIVRAQSIMLHRPLVHRMLGLATLHAHTVLGPVGNQMRGIALADAQRVFDELETEILRVQHADQIARHQQQHPTEPTA